MSWISGLFSRYWRNAHFVTILALVAVLLVRGLGVTPLVSQGILSSLYYPFTRIKVAVADLMAVHEENQKLREKLVDTSVKVAMLEEAERENIRLRSIIGFEPPTGYSLLPAKVLSVRGDQMPTTVVINKGEAEGVQINQPIINEEGLLGKVISVSGIYATVSLLTDPTNRVAVRVAESREMGIAKYVLSKGLIVDNVPSQGDVKQGDLILSSGLGGVYPSGLVVGTVKAVERPKQEPFLIIRLAPAADFNSLDELFVLRAVGR
jgi:rod shape-determining protein MreC